MPDLWKKTKTIGTFVLAMTLAVPSAGHAGVAQMRSAAAPAALGQAITAEPLSGLVEVKQHRDGRRYGRDERRSGRDQRGAGRDQRRYYESDRREGRSQGYRNGYPGSTSPRNGYRRDNNDGLFYPLAAFALGAIILNEINNNQQQQQRSKVSRSYSHVPARNITAHDNWCFSKYRSYRASDKTFQPCSGPRRYCNSPYDAL
jgi:hypothetical protein